MVNDSYLANNIERIIKEKGLKKSFVAEKANIPVNQFYSLLSGKKLFTSIYVRPIARALGVTPNDLFATDRPDKSA